MTVRRIFIAVNISDAARAACVSHIEDLRRAFPNVRVGWERAEKIHITLKFLGQTDDEILARLKADVGEVLKKHGRSSLRLSAPGVFPSKSKPRILWIGVDDQGRTLGTLQPEIEQLCTRLGFEKDDRAYRPHLTIGRVREPHDAARLAEAHLQAHIEPVEFEVADIVIYESKLQPAGSVYSVISRLNFGR